MTSERDLWGGEEFDIYKGDVRDGGKMGNLTFVYEIGLIHIPCIYVAARSGLFL